MWGCLSAHSVAALPGASPNTSSGAVPHTVGPGWKQRSRFSSWLWCTLRGYCAGAPVASAASASGWGTIAPSGPYGFHQGGSTPGVWRAWGADGQGNHHRQRVGIQKVITKAVVRAMARRDHILQDLQDCWHEVHRRLTPPPELARPYGGCDTGWKPPKGQTEFGFSNLQRRHPN